MGVLLELKDALLWWKLGTPWIAGEWYIDSLRQLAAGSHRLQSILKRCIAKVLVVATYNTFEILKKNLNYMANRSR